MAVAFGEKTGLLDAGYALNLEAGPLPASARDEFAQAALVTSTGSVGYLTEKSFDRLFAGNIPGATRVVGQLCAADVPIRRDRGEAQ